jgi:hypothetical protein
MSTFTCKRCFSTIKVVPDPELGEPILGDYKCDTCGESVWILHVGRFAKCYSESFQVDREQLVLHELARYLGIEGCFTVADLEKVVGTELMALNFAPLDSRHDHT